MRIIIIIILIGFLSSAESELDWYRRKLQAYKTLLSISDEDSVSINCSRCNWVNTINIYRFNDQIHATNRSKNNIRQKSR